MAVLKTSVLSQIRRTTTRTLGRLLPIMGALMPTAVLADGDWGARVEVRTAYSDNANRSDSGSVSERQDELKLQANGQYTSRWLAFNADYQASERRYSEDSQSSRSLLIGNSELLLGRAEQPVDLLLSHRRRTVLNAPDAIDLLRNNDERTVLSAMPRARWRPTAVDLLTVQGQFTDIDYRYNSNRNAKREGASVMWQRELSEVDTFRVTGQHTSVSFDDVPAADYDYRAVNLGYESTLRRLSYRVQLGMNESNSAVGDDLSSPSYLLEVKLDRGPGQWELNAQRFITDSSTGNGNQGDFSDFIPGESLTENVDQVERTRAALSWTHELLCLRCRLVVSAFWQDDDYRQDREDKEEVGLRLTGSYELGARSTLSLTWEGRMHRFQSSAERTDFEVQRLRLRYDYRFARGVRAGLFAHYHDRQSDTGLREYDEMLAGVRVGYQF